MSCSSLSTDQSAVQVRPRDLSAKHPKNLQSKLRDNVDVSDKQTRGGGGGLFVGRLKVEQHPSRPTCSFQQDPIPDSIFPSAARESEASPSNVHPWKTFIHTLTLVTGGFGLLYWSPTWRISTQSAHKVISSVKVALDTIY